MVAFILLFTYLGPLGYRWVEGSEKSYMDNTTVAGIQMDGLSLEEAKQELKKAGNQWKEQHPISVASSSSTFTLSKNLITFDFEETLEHAREKGAADLVVLLNRSYLQDFETTLPDQLFSSVRWEEWEENVIQDASTLAGKEMNYYLYDYVGEENIELYEEIAFASIPIQQDDSFGEFSKEYIKEISPGDSFSLIEWVNELPELLSSKEASQLATAVYSAVIQTDFLVEQRHTSLHLPSYAELGKEASIEMDTNEDLVFLNPHTSNYKVVLKQDGSTITVAIHGYPLRNSYDVSVENVETIEPRTVVQWSSFVNPGDVELIREGESGKAAQVYRVSKTETENIKQLIASDYYPPVDRVEQRYPENQTVTSSSSDISESSDTGESVTESDQNENLYDNDGTKNQEGGSYGNSFQGRDRDSKGNGSSESFWENESVLK